MHLKSEFLPNATTVIPWDFLESLAGGKTFNYTEQKRGLNIFLT